MILKLKKSHYAMLALLSGVLICIVEILIRARCNASLSDDSFCSIFKAQTAHFDFIGFSFEHIFLLIVLIFLGCYFLTKKDEKKALNFLSKIKFFFIFATVFLLSFYFSSQISNLIWIKSKPLTSWVIDCKNQKIITPIYEADYSGKQIQGCNVGRFPSTGKRDIFLHTIEN